MPRRQFQFRFQFAVLWLAAAACAGGTTPPKTSPIAETAVVSGIVEMSVVPGAAVPSVMVSVAGATMTANVSRLGEFVLPNVPAGPLELRFTGEGIAAALPAGAVAGGEVVTMRVRLTPAQAAIDSIVRIRGTAALVEGRVDTPGTPLPPNTVIVGGRIVIVPAGTPALKPGMRVRVTGTIDASGITAQSVTIL